MIMWITPEQLDNALNKVWNKEWTPTDAEDYLGSWDIENHKRKL